MSEKPAGRPPARAAKRYRGGVRMPDDTADRAGVVRQGLAEGHEKSGRPETPALGELWFAAAGCRGRALRLLVPRDADRDFLAAVVDAAQAAAGPAVPAWVRPGPVRSRCADLLREDLGVDEEELGHIGLA